MDDVDGYVPDEAEPHERTFMQWPVSRAVYAERWQLDEAQAAIARIANAIAGFEPVVLLAAAEHHAAIRRRVGGGVELWDVPTDDLWARDSGPLFVTDGRGNLAVRSLNFNGWGNKQPHAHDGRVAKRVAERMGLPVLDNGLVGEPGGVETDGHGTLLAHESSWVHDNRNPVRTRDQVEALLLEAYGADRMIWAPGLADEDITDYHIDALARFAGPGRVVIQMPADPDADDIWSQAAWETRAVLDEARDAQGKPFEIIELHDPIRPRVQDHDFVASYVNYYVCNGAVVAAQFGDPDTDAETVDVLSGLYPQRKIVTLNVDALGWLGGGIHCATQQQPAI